MSGGVSTATDGDGLKRVAARLYRGVAELAELVRTGRFAGGEALVGELRGLVARLAERAATATVGRGARLPFPSRRAAAGDEETARRLRRWLADSRFAVDAAELLEALADDELPYVESRSAEEAGLEVIQVYGHWLAAWRDGSDPERWHLVAIGEGGRLEEVAPGGSQAQNL